MGICISLQEGNSSNQPNQSEPVPVERPQLELPPVSIDQAHHDTPKLRLSQIDPKAIPDVIFKGQVIDAYVYEVYDGDTLHFLVDLGSGQVAKLALRLIGIDTPEVHAGKDKFPQEKRAGLMARDYLKTLVQGHCKIRISDWDKFGGRCLGEVLLNGSQQTANEMMITNGYARPYHGEKKQTWTLEDLCKPPFNLSRDLVDTLVDE